MFCGCDSSPTAKAPSYKFSSAELGTKEYLSKYLNAASTSVTFIDRNISKAIKAKNERNYGISDSYYEKANVEIYKWRDWIIKQKYRKDKSKLVYPNSMSSIKDAFKNLLSLKHTLPETEKLTVNQLNEILSCLRSLTTADNNFAKIVSKRERNPDLSKPKFSLRVELKPFPFSIEVLHGEFKIKQNFSIGNIAGNFGIGTSGSKVGIKTLYLVHDGHTRIYDVGNRKLSFEVPASRIDIDGQVMVITTLE
jgi:hypothetical protein